MSKYVLTAILALYVNLHCQIDTIKNNSEFESLLEQNTIDKEDSNIFDLLEYLSLNPIDINRASLESLVHIPFISRGLASQIIILRSSAEILSIDDLINSNLISREFAEIISPFLKFPPANRDDSKFSFYNFISPDYLSIRTRSAVDVQQRKGFDDGSYIGSRYKIYNRLIFGSPNKYRLGILTEKDPGENNIADFTAFNFYAENISILNKIILGDYQIEFGCGLVLSNPYGNSKSAYNSGMISRIGRGLKPYLSTNENQFLRGLAAEINLSGLILIPFYSQNFLDAITDSTDGGVKSLPLDGYHRTPNELRRKDLIRENILGLSAAYNFGDILKFNCVYYKTKFDSKINSGRSSFMTGKSFEYFSTAYNSYFKNIFLSGEFSFYRNEMASIHSAEFFISRNFSVCFSYRDYPKHFYSLHGNSFGESGEVRNETGFYTGATFKNSFGILNLYYDIFKFYEIDSELNFLSSGKDFLAQYSLKPFSKTEIRLRYKYERKEIPFNNIFQKEISESKTERLRAEIHFNASKKLQLLTRAEFCFSSVRNLYAEKGVLVFQDLRIKPVENLLICCRMIFFDTDSFNSRIYVFENDLTGVMSNSALFGEGLKWYSLFKYQVNSIIGLSIKYSELFKPNEKSLGSGGSQISNNLDNKISFQLDIKF